MTLPPSQAPLAQAASEHDSVPFGQPPHRKLNVKEAAAYLGLSTSTLNKMRLTGTGPPYMKLGRRVLYDLRDLEQWAVQRKRDHTSEF